MNNIKFSDLSGLAILTFKGGDSPLCVGELATEKPFAALEGVNLKELKTATVSNQKLDGIIRRQKKGNLFYQSVVSLVKNVDSTTFDTKLTPQVVEFVTGKKSVKGAKGMILPKLSTVELVQCVLAEFALDKFHTLNGMELKCSFYNGGEVIWKSKH